MFMSTRRQVGLSVSSTSASARVDSARGRLSPAGFGHGSGLILAELKTNPQPAYAQRSRMTAHDSAKRESKSVEPSRPPTCFGQSGPSAGTRTRAPRIPDIGLSLFLFVPPPHSFASSGRRNEMLNREDSTFHLQVDQTRLENPRRSPVADRRLEGPTDRPDSNAKLEVDMRRPTLQARAGMGRAPFNTSYPTATMASRATN
ncbi:unnamed protein product [Protopolystoma xenopodis]|uniref:Uncharacterized protein n=1 Tax=Protopolystoma xenopodis TaxID=117903 RepID=A0A3S5A4I4_9PLAT|nr:unnamed protein product [Protopolystoma xenopodis]